MRVIGWEEALLEVIARHEALPFEWSASDCFTLCMDAVKALTGDDPWASLRGKYDSELSSAKVLVRLKCGNVGDLFSKRFESVHQAFARRGDIGIVEQNGERVGVVVLGDRVIGKHQSGGLRIPRDRLVQSFKVGW